MKIPRHLSPLLAACLLACIESLPAQPFPPATSDWDRGREALLSGNSAAAEAAFSSQIARGEIGAEVYYHAGLASAGAGKVAEASLSFLRALAIDPSLSPAREELQKLATTHGIAIPVQGWAGRAVAGFGAAPIWIAASIFSWAGAVVLLLGIFRKKQRTPMIVLGVLGLLAGGGLLSTVWLGDPLFARPPLMVVRAEAPLPLRGNPIETAGPIERLPAGSVVGRLAVRGSWTYCSSPTGKIGWIPSDNLAAVVPARH